MRVLHIDSGRGWRGGQQQILSLMQGLRRMGMDQLLLASAGSPLARRIQDEGMAVEEVKPPFASLRNRALLRERFLLDGRRAFDIVHAHDARAHTLAWLTGMGSPIPLYGQLIVSRRVAFPIGFVSRSKYSVPAAYIAVSDYVRRQLIAAKVPEQKIRVIFDGVTPPTNPITPEQREAFRKRHGVDDSVCLLGALTSISPEKRLDALVGSVPEMSASASLWIGRPAAEEKTREEEEALLRQAGKLGVAQRFRILALGNDLEEFLAALDVFVYSSEMEGLGSAILLAMAHGLPVVASRVGGIPEIVRHGETGLLVGSDLGAELPAAVSTLMESNELRQRMGAAAREFVRANATNDRMVSRTATVYDEVMRGSSGSQE